MKKQIEQALAEMNPGALRMFSFIEIAEKALEKAYGEKMRGGLLPMFSVELLTLGNARMFQAHCDELAQRMAKGQDLRPATDMEVMWHLSRLSLTAPPNAEFTAVYSYIFKSVYPEKAKEVDIDFRESWKGQIEEHLSDWKKRLRVEEPHRMMKIPAKGNLHKMVKKGRR